MKLLRSILLSGVMSFALAGTASAADLVPEQYSSAADSGWYLRGDVGWSFLDFNGGSDDDNVTFGGGVGYRYNTNLRTDIRVDYAGDFDIGGGTDLEFGTVLANVYYDLAFGWPITPYIGAGAGYGWAEFSPGPDDSGFAYALMGGGSFDMTQHIALDVGYRFREVLIDGANVRDHSVLAGVRYSF